MKKSFLLYALLAATPLVHAADPINFIVIFTDDQGYGDMSCNGHPTIHTPHLDRMAHEGQKWTQFYSSAPVCTPSRAALMTGRLPVRSGMASSKRVVLFPDSAGGLPQSEITVAEVLQKAGYSTAHFGKWHIGSMRADGAASPGNSGFDDWFSSPNFYENSPLFSHNGQVIETDGESSHVTTDLALDWIGKAAKSDKPFLAVIWFGNPHSPHVAVDKYKKMYADQPDGLAHFYGEITAMDAALGELRKGIRKLGVADNTVLWYCSDNGAIAKGSTGGLRARKGSLYEGGIRVPAIIEWPAGIRQPRVTSFPASTMDIFPTLAELSGLPDSAQLKPVDGISLKALFQGEIGPRAKPIPFRHMGRAAWIDNRYKLVSEKGRYALYDLETDEKESRDLSDKHPEVFQRLRAALEAWDKTVLASQAGKDYPEGRINPGEPPSRFWTAMEAYKPYFNAWKDRPEYAGRLKAPGKKKSGGKKKPGRKKPAK